MKKYIFICLFFISSISCTKAQLLWEISGNGLEEPSYLYGTMHLGDERIYQFNDSLMPLFNQCDAFAGELILETSIFSSFRMLMDMQMENDTTLRDLLTQEEYRAVKPKLDKKLNEMGLIFAADYIERIKPIFVSMIMTDLKLEAGKEPVDLYFQRIAKKKEMEVIGLETMDEQMAVFDKIPLAKQAKMLYTELSTPQEEGMDTDMLIDLYAAQELDSLYNITLKGFDSEINEDLLFKRNINMANRMEPYMKKFRIFVGVGAAHLPGEGGVIDLLRKKGYTVRPVNFPEKE